MTDPRELDDMDLVPVESVDGDLSSSYTDEQLEQIRKKTFSSELQGLFERVTENEHLKNIQSSHLVPERETVIDEQPAAEHQTKESLVRDLHSLFYKTVNMENADRITLGFNPFNLKTQDLYTYAVDQLKEECARLDIAQYALLCFDPMKKSYAPVLTEINSINPHNLIISPEEPLYSDIFNSRDGLLITEETMSSYRYLEKRFSRNFPFNEYAYAVLVQNLVSDLWTQNSSCISKDLYPGNFYPIFIVLIKDRSADKAYIHKKLKQNIAFALYILTNKLGGIHLPEEYRTPAFLCSLIDTYGRMYSRHEGTLCLSLSYTAPFDNISYIIMTYLENRFFALVGPNSTVLHFEKNKILVFISRDDRERVESEIFNSIALFKDLISLKVIKRHDHLDLFQLISSFP
jgi:hypothetical protein